jgi:hypothetical protein
VPTLWEYQKKGFRFEPRQCTFKYTMAEKQSITDILRRAIVDSGIPFLTLEQETGVTRQSLMKFARAERTIHLDAADRLATFFGLELRPVVKVAKKSKNANPFKGITASNKEAK